MEVITVYDAYKALLIESNKVEAPALYPSDFLYYLNKTVKQYLNKRYALFETSQQLTDDLRLLELPFSSSSLSFILPFDYWHLTSCIINIGATKQYSNELRLCGRDPDKVKTSIGVKKYTSDNIAMTSDNAYLKPTIKRPAYSFDRNTLTIDVGELDSRLQVNSVDITYLKKPQVYDETDLDLVNKGANSTFLEFTEYANNEIVNQLTALVLESKMDPRLSTHIPVNTSIADMGTQKSSK